MSRSPTRQGFTLVEMLVVIVILSLLFALITRVVSGAKRKADVSLARAELSQLDNALTQFKGSYGSFPPSSIVLCEKSTDWINFPESRAIIRGMWPQFNFAIDRDINRNGNSAEQLRLNGAECLVFFLQGTVDDGVSFNGFSKSPADPFLKNGNRTTVWLDLPLSRFVDIDGDGMKELLDPQQTQFTGDQHPYVYYSSYDGRGYKPAELMYGMQDVYRVIDGGAPFMKNTYQLISPGYDGKLGRGGFFNSEDPQLSLAVGRPGVDTDPNFLGRQEQDNLANFSKGELGK